MKENLLTEINSLNLSISERTNTIEELYVKIKELKTMNDYESQLLYSKKEFLTKLK